MPQSRLQSKHPTTLRQMVLAHYLSEVLAFPSYASCHPPDTAAWIALFATRLREKEAQIMAALVVAEALEPLLGWYP